MDRKYIWDHHVIERYLADQLSDAERETFEAYYLQHPEIVAEMERVARLKVGLATLRGSNELPAVLQSRRTPNRFVAMAAAVAIVTVGLLLFLLPQVPQRPVMAAAVASLHDRSGQALAVAKTYDVLHLRGAPSDVEIELPASPHAIALRVLPAIETKSAKYRLTLFRVADDGGLEMLASLPGLAPGAGGSIAAYLDSGELSKGRYQLLLQGDQAAGTASADSRYSLTMIDAVR
jgi:hypothetical protein